MRVLSTGLIRVTIQPMQPVYPHVVTCPMGFDSLFLSIKRNGLAALRAAAGAAVLARRTLFVR
jgi:hypothetical protein